jgi:hypothetical protein
MRSLNTAPRSSAQAGFQSFNWLRGVSDDTRISIIHRLILVRLLIHRQKDGRCDPGCDPVAKELGVHRTTVLRAVDVGVRFGWLAPPIRGRRANANFVFILPNQEVSSGTTSRADQEVAPESDFLDNQEVALDELRSRSKRGKKSLKKEASETKSKASTGHGHLTGKENGQKNKTLAPTDLFGGERKAREGRKKKNNRAPPGADRFPEFWAAYPKKVDKLDAEKAFTKALAHTDAEVLIAGAKRYAIERHGEPTKYTKQPATWLNKGSWTNEASNDEAPIIDGVSGEPIASARRNRPDHQKTWKEIGEEFLAEVGDGSVH